MEIESVLVCEGRKRGRRRRRRRKDDGKKGEVVMTWSAPTEGVDEKPGQATRGPSSPG
jgi:hypothetical protein